MLKNLVGGSPRSERAGKLPRAAARKLRAVVESLKGRTMMSVALMSVAVSGVASRLIPIPAEATTVTSSRVTSNLASPGAATITPINIPLSFDKPLVDEINYLKGKAGYDATKTPPYDEGLVPQGRKALLLDRALGHLHYLQTAAGGGYKFTMTAYKLSGTDAKTYAISLSPKEPAYFTDTLKTINPPTGSVAYATTTYYDYNTAGNPMQFWVDFARKDLGGGVFGNGFVQEEIMFLETPELANAAALHSLYTRTGGSGPLDGDPTPLIFMGANRVMNINHGLLAKGDAWRTVPVADLKSNTYDMELPAPENINVLAMAAPDLDTTAAKSPAAPSVVKDLFNTFAAGFTLAKNAPGFVGKTILINTGPIGAGDFHNNKVVVNVMQQLAAIVVSQMGGQVNLKFWAYNTGKERTDPDNDVKTIIDTFNKDTNKSISNLLVIAEYVMRNIKD